MHTGHMWRVVLRLEGAHGDPLTTAKLLLHRWGSLIPILIEANLHMIDSELRNS